MNKMVLSGIFLGIFSLLSEPGYAVAPTSTWISSIQTRITALTNYVKGTVTTLPTTNLSNATVTNCLRNYSATLSLTQTRTTRPLLTALGGLNVAIGNASEARLTQGFWDKLENLGNALLRLDTAGYTDVLEFSDTTTPYTFPGITGVYSERTIVRNFCENNGFCSNDPRDQ